MPPTPALTPAVERLRALLGTGPSEVPSVQVALGSGRYDPGRRGALALVVVGLVAALVAGVVLLRGRASEEPLAVPTATGTTGQAQGQVQLVVDVEGKVRRPGLVRVPDGARVDDAIRAAGGLLPGVTSASLNLAQKVSDGQQVLVGLDPPAAAGGAGGAAAGGLLDLNLATVEQLDGLPGIGPVLAQRIVDWRTEHHRFASVDQLREVSGIGVSKYATLKSKVRV
ncbi:MAG TPA: helix-hairpin-helix domain-containing protein [Mycobacteriales bacterium]|nr:helix-hairpin-helix domain-containing protein [Mycobacteriales bacterium]